MVLSVFELMPLNINWKNSLLSRSCLDLHNTRGSRNGGGLETVVMAVGLHGSELALGHDRSDSKKRKNRDGRRSLPPEDINSVVVVVDAMVVKPNRKSSEVHWKAKVPWL